jgi:hypothetical protein
LGGNFQIGGGIREMTQKQTKKTKTGIGRVHFSSFPSFASVKPSVHSAIEVLVEKCLAARGENCGAWEAEINARVAHLYGLTPDEIKLVESAAK